MGERERERERRRDGGERDRGRVGGREAGDKRILQAVGGGAGGGGGGAQAGWATPLWFLLGVAVSPYIPL